MAEQRDEWTILCDELEARLGSDSDEWKALLAFESHCAEHLRVVVEPYRRPDGVVDYTIRRMSREEMQRRGLEPATPPTPEEIPVGNITRTEMEILLKASEAESDPYGHITWSISVPVDPEETDETDLICFEHTILKDGRVLLHAVLDCESGHFIEDFVRCLCTADGAVEEAEGIIDHAMDWFGEHAHYESLEHNTDEWLAALRQDLGLAPVTRAREE